MASEESKDTSSGAPAQSSEPLLDNPCEVSLRSKVQDRVTVVILFCINLLNYMDRFTIAGKISLTTINFAGIPNMIRDYYGIDSKLLGLLQTSFIVSYMSLSPVFGYLGDRWKRKYLIVIGLTLWSVVTLASSFVPPNVDLFADDARTRVLGFFYFAVPVGSGLGFVMGSCIAQSLNSWAWALRITPALGLLCILALIFFHQDPPRGLCTCFAGLLGVVLGSFLGRKLRVFTPVAEPYVCGGGLLLSAPFIYASLLSPNFNFYLCMFFVFIGQLLICMNWALVADMTMSIVIPTRRATASALQMVLSHSLGDAISPLIIGAVCQWFILEEADPWVTFIPAECFESIMDLYDARNCCCTGRLY
ncbi:unnamed protein product [Dibothriocephalus latus]|uniref:Major facilitator superfamily (MFS) profile domain-containing protein n=1 Tax=Dibothriocephalus latus TaxID=60516 RepID=A0A3P6UYP8_DIBLA|nr:unnamed protein product [Dibothriocephalus latus]